MPDKSVQILSTRPLPADLVASTSMDGIIISCADFISTSPILLSDTIDQIQHVIQQNTTVVFTSMNAVEAVYSQLTDRIPDWQIFCIGQTTKDLIQKYFTNSVIKATANSASDLAEKIAADHSIREVYFFCGDKRRDELPCILQKHEITVHEVTVYATHLTPQKLEKEYDAILFYSPSAVESFFSINTLPTQTIPFAIGKTTADAIQLYSQNEIIISNNPGKLSLANNAIAYFKNKSLN